MKLKFSIQYGTQWGQNLYVVITYRSSDHTEKTQRLMMVTTDGMEWSLETTVLESRKHPITSFLYNYQVEDNDGNVIRKEWDAIPRIYYFDSSKDYVMADRWRDVPLQYHLYSKAYLTTMGLEDNDKVEPLRVPLYRKTILFRVSAPQLQKGQSVAIVGSHPALGSWNVARYLRMEQIGRFEWLLSVNVEAVLLPIEYKYVIVDDNTHAFVAWEEGDNRTTDGLLPADQTMAPDGTVLVAYGESLRVKEQTWRAAGVVIPVFSLRTKESYGVGDFGDLRRLVDWCVATGMKVIQLLPVNDTTCSGNWSDSYPYNIVSAFALHPHYLDLEALGTLKSKAKMTAYHRQRQELNAISYSDYEAVDRVKRSYVEEVFVERGQQTLDSKDFKLWYAENKEWLEPYAKWASAKSSYSSAAVVYYVQYHLHIQLKSAADYARSKGIFIKGDVPIGVNGDSVETATHPEFYHLDAQTGAPPDAFSQNGQNWGFPTYNWKSGLVEWFHRRLKWMEQYFDAIRIDHILGFFRIWEIPEDAVFGILGHFSPSLPMTVGEIEYFGLSFRKDLFTRPFINDRVLDKLFGLHAPYVREHFLVARSYGLYDIKAEYDTQKKVQKAFDGRTDENSLWIRDGLYKLISGVLFLEDPQQPEMYHPRIGVIGEPVFDALTAEEKDAFMRLYNNYYYQRHNFFWGGEAIRKITDVFGSTRMLCCGEDLGMLPDCVAPVLDQLRVLTLEIQSMPKQNGYEFAHLDANPYRSVATISTHDMSPLRLWWSESPERTQRYYVSMLQKPSMLCLLSLQDWLAMDGELRGKNPRDERINVPSDPYNRWKYRMHITIEELMKADKYNNKVKTMIQRSKR